MNAVLEVQMLKAAAWREGFHAAAKNQPLNVTKPRAWQDGWYAYGSREPLRNKAQEAAQAGLRG